MSQTTPSWIPIFTNVLKDEDILKPTYAISAYGQCKLCEEQVGTGEKVIAGHVRRHRRELERYRAERRQQTEREAAERLKAVKAERDLERRVLGDDEVSGALPQKKRLYNRITSARYKLAHPEKHGNTTWSDEERKHLETALAQVQAEYNDYAKEAA